MELKSSMIRLFLEFPSFKNLFRLQHFSGTNLSLMWFERHLCFLPGSPRLSCSAFLCLTGFVSLLSFLFETPLRSQRVGQLPRPLGLRGVQPPAVLHAARLGSGEAQRAALPSLQQRQAQVAALDHICQQLLTHVITAVCVRVCVFERVRWFETKKRIFFNTLISCKNPNKSVITLFTGRVCWWVKLLSSLFVSTSLRDSDRFNISVGFISLFRSLIITVFLTGSLV